MQCKQVFRFFPLLLLALSGVTTGHAQINTSQVYTFGDSLTDNEYLYMFFGTAPEIYGSDPMQLLFEKSAARKDQLTNYAVLGSRSSEVLEQVREYQRKLANRKIRSATLVSLQGGGNDLVDLQNSSTNLFLLASAAPGTNPAADKIIHDAAHNLRSCIQLLQQRGRPQIVLWTAPDVSLSPYVLSLGFSAAQLNNIRAHNEQLNREIRQMGRRSEVVILDIARIQNFSTVAPPSILGVTISPTPAFGFATAQFADPIHPTAVMNGLVANELIWELNYEFHDNVPLYNEVELAKMAGLLP